jgi:hypothetical protein
MFSSVLSSRFVSLLVLNIGGCLSTEVRQEEIDGSHVSLLQTGSTLRREGRHASTAVEQALHSSSLDAQTNMTSLQRSSAVHQHQIQDAARSLLMGETIASRQFHENFAGQQHMWIGENGLPPYSSLHDVVGKDGVLMITLESAEPNARVTNAVQGLITAGIYPTPFPATNGKTSSTGELDEACKHTSEEDSSSWCAAEDKVGLGCRSKVEQAVTDSHRKAIAKAGQRRENWTLIMEDDVVPLMPDSFSEAFAKAWVNIPENAQIVRLGWCTFEIDHGPIEYRDMVEVDNLQIVSFMQWTDFWQDPPPKLYYAGGCTTAYMVHKAIVPEVLGIFPCCCPIDCCLEWHVYYAQGQNEMPWDPRGHQVMVSLDMSGSREMSQGYARFNQSGLLVQDNRGFESTRPEWNSTESA